MKLLERIIAHDVVGFIILVLILVPYTTAFPTTISILERQFFNPAQESATWQTLDHDFFHQDTIFRDVHFINSTHGWVIGQNKTGLGGGIILHTKDGGDSWQLQLYDNSQSFRSMDIIDNRTIWVTGTGGLVYSDDYGLTWNESIVIDIQASLGAVKFINKTHGWTSTMNDLYKTTNSGLNWQNITSWIFDDSLRMIHFVSPLEAWAIGFYGIYHTKDACETWEESFNHGGWSLSFVSNTEAWAVADSWLAKMVDGESWILQATPRNSVVPPPIEPYFTDILFLDSQNGWIGGDETDIAYTPNGGIDWYAQSTTGDTRVISIDFINLTHGWAVGWNGYIYRTTKGNNLGNHLWTGVSDTIFLIIISIPIIILVIIGIKYILHRKKRKKMNSNRETGILVK